MAWMVEAGGLAGKGRDRRWLHGAASLLVRLTGASSAASPHTADASLPCLSCSAVPGPALQAEARKQREAEAKAEAERQALEEQREREQQQFKVRQLAG